MNQKFLARSGSLVMSTTVFVAMAALQSGCGEAPELRVPAVAMQEPLLPIVLDGKIGELRELPPMPVARAHWGGSSSSQQEFIYEPPPGWIIYSVQERLISKYGDSWYTPQLTSANAEYVAETQFIQIMRDLQRTAGAFNNYKAESEIKAATDQASHWSSRLSSANNALHVRWGGRSEKVRVGPIVVDTKTASLNLDVVITIARTLSKTELELIVPALRQRIERGHSLEPYLELPQKALANEVVGAGGLNQAKSRSPG